MREISTHWCIRKTPEEQSPAKWIGTLRTPRSCPLAHRSPVYGKADLGLRTADLGLRTADLGLRTFDFRPHACLLIPCGKKNEPQRALRIAKQFERKSKV